MKIARQILCVYCFLMFDFSVGDMDCINTRCLQVWTAEYVIISGSGKSSGCVCGASLGRAGSCKVFQGTGEVFVTIKMGYCMTYDGDSNITYMGRCPYNNLPFHLANNITTNSVYLPRNTSLLNNFMCNMNTFVKHDFSVCGQQRCKGILCGECEAGLGPAVMSYTHPCVECKWYGWLLYLVLSFVPATILCFLIILWRVNVLSPPLNAIVLLTQVITSYVNRIPCSFLYHVHVHTHHPPIARLVLPVFTLYGLFNMDFFCLHTPPILRQQ